MATIPTFGLANAVLRTFEPPVGETTLKLQSRDRIRFQFNPNRLSLSKSAEMARSDAPSSKTATPPQFRGSRPRKLSFDAFFDDTQPFRGFNVERAVEILLDCCEPTTASHRKNKSGPPWVRLEWGRADTVCFNALVTRVAVEYTLFNRNGRPSRATCGLTLEEVGGNVPGQNPTSRSQDLDSVHVVRRGDALELIAYQVYGSADYWRLIADANPGTDAACLVPGTHLLLPGDTVTGTSQADS
ncbi:peptidase M23 [Streptomyces goshikiensis]|uniref:CIS tube protein n=1 Tax=Streptomyces goshikiensis TaxID=1942 RepID=UPI00367B6DEE